MKQKTGIKQLYRLTWFALMASLISLVLFAGVMGTRGDTAIFLWLILLSLLIFVLLPLHVYILIGALIKSIQGNGGAFRWVYVYLIIAFSGYMGIAIANGAFKGVFSDIAQFRRSIDEPAQVKLENALRLGPSSNIDDVRDALASGADPNAGVTDDRVPFLVTAAIRADTAAIKALLDAGADPNKRASTEFDLNSHVTIGNPLPLDVLVFSDKKSMLDSVEILLAAGADPSQSVMKLGACWRGDLPLYDLARKLGASGMLDARDQTCLHYAAAANQIAFLEALLFDPVYEGENARELLLVSDLIGQYPLDIALREKYFKAAILLVKAGGRAKKSWRVERTLANQSNDPALIELQMLLLGD